MTTRSENDFWRAASREQDLHDVDRFYQQGGKSRADREREVNWRQLVDVSVMLRHINLGRWARHDPAAAEAIRAARIAVADALEATDPWRER